MDNDTSSEQRRFAVLLTEIDRIHRGILDVISVGSRLLGLGLVVIGGGLSIGLQGNHPEILVGIPLGFLLLLVFWLRLQKEMLTLGGYRKGLEEEVNRIIGQRTLLWESYISPELLHRGWADRALFTLYAVVLAVTLGAAFAAAFDENLKDLRVPVLAGLSLFLPLAVLTVWRSYREGFAAFTKAHEIARREFRPPPG